MNSSLRLIFLVILAALPCHAFAESEHRVTVFNNADISMQAKNSKPSTKDEIERIKKERLRLTAVRKKLERKLGKLGKELRRLDSAQLKAKKARRAARDRVRKADRKIASLQKERKTLKQRVESLQGHMMDEALAAWRRTPHSSQWLGIVSGVSVSEIPHRRYLLNALMKSQAEDRRIYIQSVKDLGIVETELKQQRRQLESLRLKKKKAEENARKRASEKRGMTERVRRDVDLQNRRDEQLLREQNALLRLLEGLSEKLMVLEQQSVVQNARQRRGRLHWPLKGKIVGSFGSRLSPARPVLKGVQIKPDGGALQVKAMAAGQVRYADWFGGYGLMTIVDYGEGVLGVYAHNDALFKQLGDWVEEGEALAEAGSTGWVSNVVLYFEIRDAGKAVNPRRWCRR